MKTVSNQTDPPATEALRGKRFEYDPDRHYVMVESPHNEWDGDALDRLVDLVDPETGDFAYRVEANGADTDGRRVTGNRKKVMLSCSKEFIDRVTRENSDTSIVAARTISPQKDNEFEQLQVGNKVPIKGIIGHAV